MLYGFLGTYTSRYSDCNGYWLFGILVHELGKVDFDLFATESAVVDNANPILAAAHELAVAEFKDQLHKAGLDASRVPQAQLRVERLTTAMETVNGARRGGWNLRFHASAVTDLGRRFQCSRTIFVVPYLHL